MYTSPLTKMNRVAKTIKLAGVSGSVEQRNKLASNLNKRLFVLAKNALMDNEEKVIGSHLGVDELSHFFKKLGKGVFTVIRANFDPEVVGSIAFSKDTLQSKQLWAIVMDLPLVKISGRLKMERSKIGTLSHEGRHFFDYITQPKMAASYHKVETFKNKDSYWDFYKKHLYMEKEPAENNSEVLAGLKNKINSHFEEIGTPLDEKISVLQDYRYRLQTESNAQKDDLFYFSKLLYDYKKNKLRKGEETKLCVNRLNMTYDSLDYKTKKEKVEALQKYEKGIYAHNIKIVHDDSFAFSAKIKMLEEMLAENLSKARVEHKNALDLKSKGEN